MASYLEQAAAYLPPILPSLFRQVDQALARSRSCSTGDKRRREANKMRRDEMREKWRIEENRSEWFVRQFSGFKLEPEKENCEEFGVFGFRFARGWS